MKVSAIIVTRNRASDLKQTLESMRRIVIPGGLEAELLVVDNGSNDTTPDVVRACQIPGLPVRYLREERPGQSRGRNLGLAQSIGEIIAFIDDDVRPPTDWLGNMCEPMVQHKASVVAGGVALAPHLLRPWMTKLHRSYLASSEWLNPDSPHSMVGANMAFSREVLRRVPGFDPNLGPGTLGFGDDELFAMQLVEAGYKIYGRLDTSMEHHFQTTRLKRESWLSSAAQRGAVNAYLTYHWHHRGYRAARPRLWIAQCKLQAYRLRFRPNLVPEGCSEEEVRLIYQCGELRFFLKERGRPRRYPYHGLALVE